MGAKTVIRPMTPDEALRALAEKAAADIGLSKAAYERSTVAVTVRLDASGAMAAAAVAFTYDDEPAPAPPASTQPGGAGSAPIGRVT